MGMLGFELNWMATKQGSTQGKAVPKSPQLTLHQQPWPSLSPSQWQVGTSGSAQCHFPRHHAAKQVKNMQGPCSRGMQHEYG